MYIYDKRYQSCSFVARGRVGGLDTNSYKAIANSNDPYIYMYACLKIAYIKNVGYTFLMHVYK